MPRQFENTYASDAGKRDATENEFANSTHTTPREAFAFALAEMK